ncbi:hypothetical protein HUJ05_001801 [Dendroctonus ponderosae]|nr:hypothetical protein HUJ05_001801 [Dendroctonus ponderosae]
MYNFLQECNKFLNGTACDIESLSYSEDVEVTKTMYILGIKFCYVGGDIVSQPECSSNNSTLQVQQVIQTLKPNVHDNSEFLCHNSDTDSLAEDSKFGGYPTIDSVVMS